MRIIYIIFTLFSFNCLAYERADAFMVQAFDSYYKVLSPTKFYKKSSVIIENKTITRIVGKLISDRSDNEIHMAINPRKIRSVAVNLTKGEKLYFVPLSPPFQKVVLKLGKKSYEIPPKK